MGQRPSRYNDSSPDACWEVVDDEVIIRAQHYRTRLQQTWDFNNFREIVEPIRRFYLALDLQPLMLKESPKYYDIVKQFFNEAYDKNEVKPVIKAYTSATNLYKLINKDLANLVSIDNFRDIALSPDAPKRRYWEGSLDIACIIVNHPDLDRYRIIEETQVFRGMTVPITVLANYCKGNRFMNKTFLSTSKRRDVADIYKASTADEVGCLCIYTLVPSKRRTAIDIQDMLEFNSENEVLILPYTIFEVEDVYVYRIGINSDQYTIKLRESPS